MTLADSATSSALLNATGTIPGPLNPELYVPFLAPPGGKAPGSGVVLTLAGLNTSLNVANAPAPVNLTAENLTDPWSLDPGVNYVSGVQVWANGSNGTSTSSGSNSTTSASAAGRVVVPGAAAIAAAAVGLVMML